MAQVVSRADKFKQLKTQVITISFVGEPHVSTWLAETQSPFLMLLDPSRTLYKAYGLDYSVWRSWGLRNLWYYVQALASGRKLLGRRGDPNQLGGDFIIDAQGIVRYAHPSRDPTDRPEAEALIAILQ